MTELLMLPAQAARYGSFKVLAPMIGGMEFVMALIIGYMLHQKNVQPDVIRYIIPGFLIFSGLLVPVILKIALKPADITINRTSIDVAPMGVFGYGGGETANHGITEFDRVEIAALQTKSGPVYKVVLRAKKGKENDLVFDPPARTNIHDCIARLGATLNLKVNDNVTD